MVITIALIFCIPATLCVGGYFILKAFELGKAEIKQKIVAPVEEKIEPVQVDETSVREFQEFINEYTGL